MDKIEYRVRPVTRYIVTSFRDEGDGGCSGRGHGEFDNEQTAYEVGYALARAEHERMGWPLDDERIQYPRAPEASTVSLDPASQIC